MFPVSAQREEAQLERLAALVMIEPHANQAQVTTLAGDKGFDTQDFVAELREARVTRHVAQNTNGRRSAIDGRTTRHAGYQVSLRKLRHRRLPKIDWQFTLARATYNLVRLPKRLGAAV